MNLSSRITPTRSAGEGSPRNTPIPRLRVGLVCVLSLFAVAAQAQEKPAAQPVKHRVTGLFMPEREKDLREVVESKLPEVKLLSIDYQNSEATFEYDADKLFNKPKPEQIPERFDNLLRSVSNSTFGIRPLCTTPKDKLKLVEIGVVGLDCKACCLVAYEAIYNISGVEQATASFKAGLVTALIDPEKTNVAALEAALKMRQVELKPR